MKNSIKIRINPQLKKELENKLPGMTWSNRISTVYNYSVIKHQEKIDSLGNFIYGKNVWEKIKKR